MNSKLPNYKIIFSYLEIAHRTTYMQQAGYSVVHLLKSLYLIALAAAG